MRRRAWVGLGLAAALLAWILYVYVNDVDSAQAVNRTRPLALAITAAFILAMVILSFLDKVDGFSLGSAVIAVLLEVIIFVGWIGSPQEEADRFFLLATLMPLILVGVTLLFNALQREA